MKKALLVLLALSALVFSMTGVASAEGWNTRHVKTHYGFSLTTEGCAGCHVTHVANAAKLLVQGPSQTDFCYWCHAGLASSPYNVDDGLIRNVANTATNNSTAGGFGMVGGATFAATSIHNVEAPGAPSSGDFLNASIPGTSASGDLKGGFRCGSCHDPHAGDKPNDRLLRETPITGGGTVTTINFVYNAATDVVTDYAADVAANTALNNWCGTCHGKFNVGDDAAKTMSNSKYRHAMGVAVDPASTTLDAYLGVQGATDGTHNLLNCLSCHYAHGSDKTPMATYKSWTRDVGGLFNETDSTLLRMDKRGVCFDCHGAATTNLEAVGQSNS